MAKIVALACAHLGRAYYHRLSENGLNQREEDFNRSFQAAVDLTIAEEPDLFLWLGDVFDHPRPTYRSFREVNRALFRLGAAGIPGVVISGNHDTPRLRGTGSPYGALQDTHPGVHFTCALEPETLNFPRLGLCVHAVPHTSGTEDLKSALDQVSGSTRADATNVLASHLALTSLATRLYRDINEIEVDEQALHADRFDVVLLGHWHSFQNAAGRAWYAGATDTFHFGDVDEKRPEKGILVLETDDGPPTCRSIPDRRPLLTLPRVDALDRSPGEITAELEARAGQPGLEGAVVRVFVNDLTPEVAREIDWRTLHRLFDEAGVLHVKIDRTLREASGGSGGIGSHAAPLPTEWRGYCETADLAGFDRERIVSTGLTYLEEATG